MLLKILQCCLLFNLVHSLSEHPILIVVSYDAFRYDYFKKNASPFMVRLKTEGTSTEYLNNVFPTKTFPNHHTISTGLYAEVHGVTGNSFYDPKLQEVVKIGYDMFHYNENIVPIWMVNERASKNRYSGIMMWPGGSYPYQNQNATYMQPWVHDFDWKKRVDTAISWIKDPKKPANLVMIYFEEPDMHGHVYGPDSQTVLKLIQKLDNITKYLHTRLVEENLASRTNVIHLSDHGMISVVPPNIINVTQYLQPDTYIIADTSPCLHVIPKKGFESDIYNRLKNASNINRHYQVFKKEEMPPRWYYKNNPRTPPIFLLADPGYAFQDLQESAIIYEKEFNITITPTWTFGAHGYDNTLAEMHPFFIAYGPNIKKKHKVPPFNSVDLYSLFCALLNVKGLPNNGTFDNVKDILVTTEPSKILSTILIAAGGIITALLLIGCAAAITLSMIRHQQNATTVAALNKRFPQTFNHSSIEAQHLLEEEA